MDVCTKNGDDILTLMSLRPVNSVTTYETRDDLFSDEKKFALTQVGTSTGSPTYLHLSEFMSPYRLARTVAKSHECRLHYFASRATRALYYDVFATFPVKKFHIGHETVFDSRQAFTPRRA